jgi:macrolide transport system ATP-binding/permease protein
VIGAATPAASGALLELRGAVRRYASGDQQVVALRGVDFSVRRGEMVALMGASGSGKSTLMNILGCLDRLSEGSYRVAGQDTSELGPEQLAELRRAHFGFVFQRYNLLSQLSAQANVEMPAVYANLDAQERHARARALLERLGLGARATHLPRELSGGQQQRVSIARALINGGEVILADEPTGALDSANGREVLELLTELNRQGHTIIVATHDLHVAGCAQRIVEVADGVIISDRRTDRAAPLPTPHSAERPLVPAPVFSRSPWERFFEVAKMAWTALLAHRLRSGLTLLGVVIGIVSVTMMVAVGESASRVLEDKFGSVLKLKELIIYPGHVAGDPFGPRIKTLKASDVQALRREPYVLSATFQTYTTALLRYRSFNRDGSAVGVGPGYFDFQGFHIKLGSGFTQEDFDRQAPVTVIDDRTHKQFFGDDNPLNKVIYIGSLPCVVVGVVAQKPGWAEPGNRLSVFLPYTTSNARLTGRNYLDMVWVRLQQNTTGEEGVEKISNLLAERHRAKDVWVDNNDASIRAMESFSWSLRMLLAAIAAISLIVGGIGVMNIMLVSVSERAREIGVRVAVGARQADIRRQFLIEAVVLCLMGAVLGVLLSFVLSYAATYALPPGWDIRLSTTAILAATLCAALTGLVFGYFPARNAAALDPVDALSRD